MTVDRDWLSDPQIRQGLRSLLRKRHSGKAHTVFIEELGISQGRARIDVAVVNGQLHGYEIKSDRDSLRRLPDQVEFYSKVVDKATLVVGDRHLAESSALVPEWWGILRVESSARGPQFKSIRRGRRNPSVEVRSLVELLWRDDAIELLEQRGTARGVRSKPRRAIWDKLCEQFEAKEIAAAVRDQLRARATQQDLLQP